MIIFHDLLGTWSGLLTFAVIIITALAVPGGVIYALHREIKGQAELAGAVRHPTQKHG